MLLAQCKGLDACQNIATRIGAVATLLRNLARKMPRAAGAVSVSAASPRRRQYCKRDAPHTHRMFSHSTNCYAAAHTPHSTHHTRTIKDHLPHVGNDGAEVVSAVVLEQYSDGDDLETIADTLVDMLPTMIEDYSDVIDDVETAVADLLDALATRGGVFDQLNEIASPGGVVLFETGAECLALLAEDDAWHPATMVEDTGAETVHIRFEECVLRSSFFAYAVARATPAVRQPPTVSSNSVASNRAHLTVPNCAYALLYL